MNSGKKFMNLRESLGLTQKQVADAIGVTDQTVSNWERGVHVPRLTLGQAVQLCKITKQTLQELASLFEAETLKDKNND
jgi:DNA-binding XRE family transcriptional regulator